MGVMYWMWVLALCSWFLSTRGKAKMKVWGLGALASLPLLMLSGLLCAADAVTTGNAQALAAKAVDVLSTPLAIGGATAVPLYITLENFIMTLIPTGGGWAVVRTLLPAVFSLIGWFGMGTAKGMDSGSMLTGAMTTWGGSVLIHEVLDRLGSLGKLAEGVLPLVLKLGSGTVTAPGAVTAETLAGWVAKGDPRASHYNTDGSLKVV